MSIFGAMFSGVTGLEAQSQALGMIADNISNVNTVGYKGTSAQFYTLVTQAATRTSFTPGGVQSSPVQGIDRQGLLQASSSETDIAITGRGFFVVNEAASPTTGNEFLFTRAGSFVPDENGNLRNTAGYYLQGWPLSSSGALPSNTSVLSSVKTVNVSGLAGTARPTTAVDLALNLPSTAPIDKGGGEINSNISSTALAGITDLNFNNYGTLGDVAKITYNASTKIMTVDINGQTGTFDLTAQSAGLYFSTGTLSGMEMTLSGSFNFGTGITTQTNTIAETNGTGAEPANFTQATKLAGISTISFNSAVLNDHRITVDYNSATGVVTLTNLDTAQSGTVTIGTTGGVGLKDFVVAAGALAGTVVTVDTNTFNFSTSFSTTTTAIAVANSGAGAFAASVTTPPTFTAATLRQLDASQIVLDITDDGAGAETVTLVSGPTGYTVAVQAGDLGAAGASTLRFTNGGNIFDIVLNVTTGRSGGGAGNESRVTFTLNELANRVVADSDDLVTAATAPTISGLNAGDLKALNTTNLSFNVDANGRAYLASGPTGWSVDQAQSQSLNAAGTRNIVVTDGGNNSFTVTFTVTTPITKGSADVAVNLLELQNSVGVGTASVGSRFSSTVQVFDSLGNAHDLELEYVKTATNQWSIRVKDPLLSSSGVKSGTVAPSTRSISFNGDGTPLSITFPAIQISGWTTGANNSTVAFDLGTLNKADGVTQFAGEFSISSIDQDGVRFGGFTGVQINEKGVVTAVFDNGEQLAVYQLPIAMFASPNGLQARTGNAYAQTDRSGDILLQQANAGGAGVVASSALESSTVDLAEEFTKMITTQRAYSASARIITTADDMLEELIRIRR